MKTYATIYRSAKDASNYGLSAQHDNLWVVNPLGMRDGDLDIFYRERGNFLVVCPNVIGKGVHLKPYVEMKLGYHQMFGGNFAYSSCESFKEVTGSNAPVKIHDRIER